MQIDLLRSEGVGGEWKQKVRKETDWENAEVNETEKRACMTEIEQNKEAKDHNIP